MEISSNHCSSYERIALEEPEAQTSKCPTPRRAGALAAWTRHIAFALLPSPLHPHVDDSIKRTYRRGTSYLDGIRGIGAVLVFIQHFATPFQPAIVGDQNRYLNSWSAFQYPIIRLFYSGGSFAVAIFFVVSGFALARKPMALRVKCATENTHIESTISSAIFRRGIRLFLPTVAVVFAMMIGTCIGAYDWSVPGLPTSQFDLRSPTRLPSFINQFTDALYFVLSNVFYPAQWLHHVHGFTNGIYGFHLWTISVEFWASQFLFLSLLAFIQLGRALRMVCFSLLLSYALWCLRWEIALFLAGALICDFDLSSSPLPSNSNMFGRAIQTTIPWLVCFLGLWAGSMPDFNGDATPGFHFLWSVVPFEPVWHSFGAVLVVLSVTRSGALQALFELGFVQYFGRISFSLYLVHVPILSSFGWRLVHSLLLAIDPYSQTAYCAFLWVCGILFLAFVVWVADVFWRFVDEPSIRLAKYLDWRLRADDMGL